MCKWYFVFIGGESYLKGTCRTQKEFTFCWTTWEDLDKHQRDSYQEERVFEEELRDLLRVVGY